MAGLVYPVITPITTNNGRTFEELLGPHPNPVMRGRRTPSDHVTPHTPPLFLAHALDDQLVQPENTLAMLAATRTAKVATEVHLFESGDHGFGLTAAADSTTALWPDLFSRFLTRHL